MAPKSKSSDNKSSGGKSGKTDSQFSAFTDSDSIPPRILHVNLELNGIPFGGGEFMVLAIFNGVTILDGKWQDGLELETSLPMNLNDFKIQALISSNPIFFLLRAIGAKPSKADPDPFLHADNRGGGSVDLFSLLMGQEEVFTDVRLVSIVTGEFIGCGITVRASAPGITEQTHVPLLLTMISAHCMPTARDGTVYVSAIGLTDIHHPTAINFGPSLSTPDAKKLVWAVGSTGGLGANTAYSVSQDDKFVPDDFNPKTTQQCLSFYWNSCNRVRVISEELIERLSTPFLIEVAGVPRVGKVDVRGRYMGWVDARALLEPGQLDMTVCTKLLYYSEQVGAGLLDLPATSAKGQSARDSDMVLGECGHTAHVVIRFDLMEPLVNKTKLLSLYDIIGFLPCGGPQPPGFPVDKLESYAEPEAPVVDNKFIRKESGALAVHKELSNLACRGAVPMTQGIKRSAANRLLMRVRTVLKNFPSGECSYLHWQDTVSRQHAASIRAVTASFAPQPPHLQLPEQFQAARCRQAGDNRLDEKYCEMNMKVAADHPKSLLVKTIRCLEIQEDTDARSYLFEALHIQTRNRYLLWILGAHEFDKGPEGAEIASAAFRIAVKGDYSDGTANAIAWAALHACYHYNGNPYGAHIAAKRMRKCYTLPKEWIKFLKRWSDVSGEEEVYWKPSVLSSVNPYLITAAFFLCLRCYKFCEVLMHCVENYCFTRESNRVTYHITADLYYLKAALCILRRQYHTAVDVIQSGVRRFGPSALLSQIRATCQVRIRGWDDICEEALVEAEKAGSELCPSLLYKAALCRFKTDPKQALQRVALAHKLAPSGHTALLIGRIHLRLGEDGLAERWCAAAMKIEPFLADGWAMLSLLAMYQRNLDKARTMLRTAKQVGPISPDLEEDLQKVMDIVQLDSLPDSLVKKLCIKKNYDYL